MRIFIGIDLPEEIKSKIKQTLHPSLELNELKKKIDSEFLEYIRPDEKAFVPHVTVKRWQRYEYDLLAEGIIKYRLPDLSFTVERISLFKSERDENNLKYHVIN